MTKTFRFICSNNVATGAADLLTSAEAAKSSQYTILPRLSTAGMSATDLRANCLATRADRTVLIGDDVPVLWGNTSPDGHAPRNLHCCKLFATDGAITVDANNVVQAFPASAPWGAVSRVWYKAQPGDPRSSLQLYRDWLTKIVTPIDPLQYRVGVSTDDQLAKPGFEFIGQAATGRIPLHLLRDWFQSLPVNVPDLASPNTLYQMTDGVLVGWNANPVDVASIIAPGQEFPQLVGFWYVGQTPNLRSNKPRCRVGMGFGSYQVDYSWPDNFPIAWTTLADTISAVYNLWGQFPIETYLAGSDLGDAQLALARGYLAAYVGTAWAYLLDIIGDCTQSMSTDQLDIADLRGRTAALEAWKATAAPQLAALVSAGPGTGGGGGTPPPGIVVIAAHYRQVANPSVFVDVTVQVQALVNAGTPWSVHPGLADPYVGILKELWVQWTHGGPVQTQVFAQLQQVVLA